MPACCLFNWNISDKIWDRLLLGTVFSKSLSNCFVFFSANPANGRTPLSFAFRRAAPVFRSSSSPPPPGRSATPAGIFLVIVFAAVLFETLAKSFRLGFFFPAKTSSISGMAVSSKFLPTCLATGKTYFLLGEWLHDPYERQKLRVHLQIPSVWLVHCNWC